MGLPYVPLTFPTVTVRNNMAQTQVSASTAEVDRLWEAYKRATVVDGISPYNKDGGSNLAIIQALETATDYQRLKVVAWLNALDKAVKEQGFGWLWLDPAGAKEAGSPLIDPVGALKRTLGDAGQAVGNFLTPVADPVTNVLKWSAVLVGGAAVIYGIYHGTKLFNGRKRRKG